MDREFSIGHRIIVPASFGEFQEVEIVEVSAPYAVKYGVYSDENGTPRTVYEADYKDTWAWLEDVTGAIVTMLPPKEDALDSKEKAHLMNNIEEFGFKKAILAEAITIMQEMLDE